MELYASLAVVWLALRFRIRYTPDRQSCREEAIAVDQKTDLASEIKSDGKHIAAQIKAARRYEAAAEEKAGTDLRKAADHWTSVFQRLAVVRTKCKEAGISFKTFKAEYCPDLGRTKLYKALAIADGRSTAEQEQEKDAKRQAAKRAKVSVTSDVTDSLPDDGVEARKAEHARLAGDEPQVEQPVSNVVPIDEAPKPPCQIAEAWRAAGITDFNPNAPLSRS